MPKNEPIAIVGMGGVFPGALNTDELWQNIINRVDAVCDIPAHRWVVPVEAVYSQKFAVDKTYSRKAGVVDLDFDGNGFEIAASLLERLDPLYHYTLTAAREAFDGCRSSSIIRSRTGVILAAIALPTEGSAAFANRIIGRQLSRNLFGGASSGDTYRFSQAELLSARVTSQPASLLAKAFRLGGGSYTLDAACSTSLYAVKLACDELTAGRADAMIAGGVSRPEILYTQVGFTQLKALSPSGCCRPFDAAADGLVVGEGAGLFVLKRLSDAIRDEDHIYGLIRAIGLSNDIGGNLLSPESEGQLRAMRAAYDRAGWSAHDVDFIECHGTGTPVGDAVELNSMRTLWGDSGWHPGQCPIGSVKSMVGHLLTAAGAASMIKTLLGFKHGTLPPSVNFSAPGKNSPLLNGPFRVQTAAESWQPRKPDDPRRAAVSSFGFGGINAHILLEEWTGRNVDNKPVGTVTDVLTADDDDSRRFPDIAVVGMEAVFGKLDGLRPFQETVLRGDGLFTRRAEERWRGCEETVAQFIGDGIDRGVFINEVSILIGEYHIPPNEIDHILCQHLLALNACRRALLDAGMPLREKRPAMGVVIGMDFDAQANDYHFRWNLTNEFEQWKQRYGLASSADENRQWIESIKDAWSPPLTASRVVGALGGIMASRIAKQFQLGGPGFVVSCESASGLRALEIGTRSLQLFETDTFLVGAVDLPGDVRRIVMDDTSRSYSRAGKIRAFDAQADGTLPGEGATALVLKRLDDAVADGDRIYAVIKGIGSANSRDRMEEKDEEGFAAALSKAYTLSLERAFIDADIDAAEISYFEANGSGDPREDQIEAAALRDFFTGHDSGEKKQCALGSVKANIGHTGAAAGLASFVRTCLCLYQQIIPPLRNFTEPARTWFENSFFHMPHFPYYWLRNRIDGTRKACTGVITRDGVCMHVVAEEYDYPDNLPQRLKKQVDIERRKPLGFRPGAAGLFVVEGDNDNELIQGLDSLYRFIMTIDERDANIEKVARQWHLAREADSRKLYALSIVAADVVELSRFIDEARQRIAGDQPASISGRRGIRYSTSATPVGAGEGEIAFVFPGSGNHFLGMARDLSAEFPEVMRLMDKEARKLRDRFLPEYYFPYRTSWQAGWEEESRKKISSDPLNMIIGQVSYGGLTTCLAEQFGLKPDAVIGYSLGESAGLFATGAWNQRSEMLDRMRASDLFTTQLAGPCNAARQVWNVPPEETVDWCVAVVNRDANGVKKVTRGFPAVHLLIVNTPTECVIGGRRAQVEEAIKSLGCEAVFLEGVVTVHCDAAVPVKQAYKELHVFPVVPPKNVRFYSCARGRSYELTSEAAAQSILDQAVYGFDFTQTVRHAYKNGVRIFLEMGPHNSCSRMIQNILNDSPHLAVSICHRSDGSYSSLLKFLGCLISERVPVNMDFLYGRSSCPESMMTPLIAANDNEKRRIRVKTGGIPGFPAMPGRHTDVHQPSSVTPDMKRYLPDMGPLPSTSHGAWAAVAPTTADSVEYAAIMDEIVREADITARAHQSYLTFTDQLNNIYAHTFSLQAQLLEKALAAGDASVIAEIAGGFPEAPVPQTGRQAAPVKQATPPTTTIAAFPREMCMEFAIGSIENVLGPMFAEVDTYPVRVRLPDEPLMLVDRIISVEGEKGSLKSGKVVTEHDVLPGAWYLDGDRAPVCISIEAGQADLFLCSYLGIDLAVKGERSYRLLDAVATFHEGLPRLGDTIRYEIKINRFVRQGKTYLFFFEFDGLINNRHVITMRNGCAGFFTPAEVKASGGIVLTAEEKKPVRGVVNDWHPLVPVNRAAYDDRQIEALRNGDTASCFGELFTGIELAPALRLPAGRMKLIHRVKSLEPNGGRYGLGRISAEADIHPDDWFLTCHFVDDMVMPGTLMYQCCEQALRVLLLRLGWVSDSVEACFEPVPDVGAILKCRGPVTAETRQVIYEVELSEIGYNPEPYVKADAFIYADGERIVSFRNMSLKMTGVTREELETFWAGKQHGKPENRPAVSKPTLYDRNKLLAYAIGSPSEAFGEPYRIFDKDRVIARLPGPPYFFMDRVTAVEPPPWIVKADGWIEAEFTVKPDDWYFAANRQPSMPFCILLEIALQPCGWLAAYAGSALKSQTDVKFRNLGGKAVQYVDLMQERKTLNMRCRMTKVSESGGMIIENFDIEVLCDDDQQMVYQGTTYFGFFSQQALSRQVGIPGAANRAFDPSTEDLRNNVALTLHKAAPLTPDDSEIDESPALAMPSGALLMIDGIETYLPRGGSAGLGFIRGVKQVDPGEWFFKAHFYQDPVCPGSLGLESFLQLLKYVCLDRWPHLSDTHRFEFVLNNEHEWIYRGQVIPTNRQVEVDADIIAVEEKPFPAVYANGFLKVDGLFIYEMKNFGLRLVPVAS